MKILIAIGVARQETAGAAGVVFNHANQLRKRGHKVDCWFLEDIFSGTSRSKRVEAVSFAFRVARRILREGREYDVVNLHAPWGCVYGVWRKLRGASDMPPYVLTMQGSEERYVRAMRLEHKKGQAWNFGWKNRLWHRIYHQTMYDYSIRTADYGAVADREGWICAELKYGRQPGTIRFVPNGVEDKFFTDRNYSPRSPVRLLFVGSWLDRKGIYYLAEAFRMLVRDALPVSLTVAGCGSSQDEVLSFFAPEIRELVRAIPHATRDEMPCVYGEHDVFVFPSLVEGMPLTLLEAMASGMPVVTTESCGMADVVEHGFNGLLVPPADGKGLAMSVAQLCKSVDLRRQLGEEARRTMRRYRWETVSAKLEEILSLAAGAPCR